MIFALPLQSLPPLDFRSETAEYLLRQIVRLWGVAWVRRTLEHFLTVPADAEVLWTEGGATATRRCYLLRQRDAVELQLWCDDRFVSSTRFQDAATAHAAAEEWRKDLM